MPQMGIQPEKKRGRKDHTGKPVFPVTGPSFIVWESFLYFWLYIEING